MMANREICTYWNGGSPEGYEGDWQNQGLWSTHLDWFSRTRLYDQDQPPPDQVSDSPALPR